MEFHEVAQQEPAGNLEFPSPPEDVNMFKSSLLLPMTRRVSAFLSCVSDSPPLAPSGAEPHRWESGGSSLGCPWPAPSLIGRIFARKWALSRFWPWRPFLEVPTGYSPRGRDLYHRLTAKLGAREGGVVHLRALRAMHHLGALNAQSQATSCSDSLERATETQRLSMPHGVRGSECCSIKDQHTPCAIILLEARWTACGGTLPLVGVRPNLGRVRPNLARDRPRSADLD